MSAADYTDLINTVNRYEKANQPLTVRLKTGKQFTGRVMSHTGYTFVMQYKEDDKLKLIRVVYGEVEFLEAEAASGVDI